MGSIPSSDDMEDKEDSELKPMWPLPKPPLRPMEIPGLAMRASARSKTFPWNAAAKELLEGVVGTVACIAGPRAALCGVMGTDVGDMPRGYDCPFIVPEGWNRKCQGDL